jgi:hypothetical protein
VSCRSADRDTPGTPSWNCPGQMPFCSTVIA